MSAVQDIKERKDGFDSVYKSFFGKDLHGQDMFFIDRALSHSGIVILDLFAENNPSKLGLCLSELVVKRTICKIELSAAC